MSSICFPRSRTSACLRIQAFWPRNCAPIPADRWVVLDGIQRLPALLNEVHRFIEERKMRFVLCGSSARQLSRAGVNQLAGRALRRAMHPFVPGELGDRFDLEDALQYGLLPIVWDSEDRSETLTALHADVSQGGDPIRSFGAQSPRFRADSSGGGAVSRPGL